MLISGEIPQIAIMQLKQEDSKLLDNVLVDAITEYSKQGKVQEFVKLRQDGYLSDACVYDYWEVIGARLPDEATVDTTSGPDQLLIHELVLAYFRDDYAIRYFRDMLESGQLTTEDSDALAVALGFDYTDDLYLNEHGIGLLRDLNIAEKEAYETILQFADDGDCRSIANRTAALL